MVKIASPNLHHTLPNLRQKFLRIDGYGSNKQTALTKVLVENPPKNETTMIFCNADHTVRLIERYLSTQEDVKVAVGGPDRIVAIHRHLTIQQRRDIVERFQQGQISTLIATDMASRGWDTTHVGHVVLYDFPYSKIDYLHRVGRTARANGKGRVTSLVARKDRSSAGEVEMAVRKRKALA